MKVLPPFNSLHQNGSDVKESTTDGSSAAQAGKTKPYYRLRARFRSLPREVISP